MAGAERARGGHEISRRDPPLQKESSDGTDATFETVTNKFDDDLLKV
jgi:hypothetical protein